MSGGFVMVMWLTHASDSFTPRNPAFCAPITSNRELGACLIANVPMRELLAADLRRAGLQLVDPKDAEPRAIRIPIDNWIELGALLLLGRNPNSACLLDSDGNTLAWKGCANPKTAWTKSSPTPIAFPSSTRGTCSA